ncbi:putative NinX [Vibrio phage 120E34-1]|nr:putative NinX [Vibrio phage 120E34-1]
MNYEEMSDFEINKSVASHLPIDWCWMDCTVYLDIDHTEAFDPCNNPSDAWPIILKHGISITFDGIDWEADTSWMGCEDINRSCNNIEKNAVKPLRAAMICFLKVKEVCFD